MEEVTFRENRCFILVEQRTPFYHFIEANEISL